MYSADYFFFTETLSDNAFNGRVDGENTRGIAAGGYDGSNTRVTNEWSYHYSGIRKCNTLLENIGRITDLDATLRDRIVAEASVIRAFHYIHLLTWYGPVPLVTRELSIDESQRLTRTHVDAIEDFIYRELDNAAAHLPGVDQYAQADRGRITKGAALALKARLALYRADWALVESLTQAIMDGNAGPYDLFDNYAGLFTAEHEYNREVILDLEFVPNVRIHSIQRYFIPKTEGQLVTSIAPAQELVDSYRMLNGKNIRDAGSGYDESNPYANRDPRLHATIVYDGDEWQRPDGSTLTIRTMPGTGDNSVDYSDASPTGYYVRKYFDKTHQANQSGLNLILIRYADVLLMHAEAKNNLHAFTETVWNNTIRRIRVRAGFTDAGALDFHTSWSQATLEEIIRQERRAEFAMEGQRIFDLKRWRTAESALSGWLHGIRAGDPAVDDGYLRIDNRAFDAAKHYLWPVPLREVSLNKNLNPNNPGW
jgi:starch-binding outer membrane protein, SusD/RagB family